MLGEASLNPIPRLIGRHSMGLLLGALTLQAPRLMQPNAYD